MHRERQRANNRAHEDRDIFPENDLGNLRVGPQQRRSFYDSHFSATDEIATR
jgi:hypothetical protein